MRAIFRSGGLEHHRAEVVQCAPRRGADLHLGSVGKIGIFGDNSIGRGDFSRKIQYVPLDVRPGSGVIGYVAVGIPLVRIRIEREVLHVGAGRPDAPQGRQPSAGVVDFAV